MSIVYEKSVSQKYRKYFLQSSDLKKSFKEYSIKKQCVEDKHILNKKPWENGIAGVPLLWDKSANKVIIDHTDSHTLVIGPTGSKKSRLIVMPFVRILGSAHESLIISDPKAEVYNRTASFLEKQGYNIFVLNLRSPMHGDRWNPLALPYEFFCKGEVDKAYEFVNDIAENLIQSDKSQNDPFWDNSAGSFFFGIVLLLFKYCKDYQLNSEYVHMGNVMTLRNELFSGYGGGKNTKIWEYAKTDLIITSALIGTVETANETRSGILSVFDQKIRMFSIQPNILDLLSHNDIDLTDIGKKPTVVYLIIPDEKTGYHSLVSLFVKQSYEYIIYQAQLLAEKNGSFVGELSNRVNYVLDEFSSLPTIRDFPSMITASRSRNIRFTLVIQSKHQLIQRYKEEAETIQTNCNNWIFLSSRELKLLEEISAMCGKTLTEQSKPILSVSLLQRLDKENGEALLLCGRLLPCITILCDIDLYDDNKYEKIQVCQRKTQKLCNLDFKKLYQKNSLDTKDIVCERKNLLESDMYDLLNRIDKRIVGLENDEK